MQPLTKFDFIKAEIANLRNDRLHNLAKRLLDNAELEKLQYLIAGASLCATGKEKETLDAIMEQLR